LVNPYPANVENSVSS